MSEPCSPLLYGALPLDGHCPETLVPQPAPSGDPSSVMAAALDPFAYASHVAEPPAGEGWVASSHAAEPAKLWALAQTGSAEQPAPPGVHLVLDRQRQQLSLLSDAVGRQPLYYAEHDSLLLFSTDLRWLALQLDPDLDSQALFDYTFFHMVPSPGSIYRGIAKLPAGSHLCAAADGLRVARHWLPTFTRERASTEELSTRLRQVLRDAVARALPEVGRSAAFLSGGLDSSTVAGHLAGLQNTAHAYAIGFDAPGYDEMPYARITAEHFGLELHEHYITPQDVTDTLPSVATAFDEPFGNSSALPAYLCARAARSDGFTHLLAGDGGDELFAGNTRYLSHEPFERFNALPRPIRALIAAGAHAVPASTRLGRRGRSFLLQASMPLPDRLYYYNFLHNGNAQDIFSPALLGTVDREQPLQLARTTYHAPAGGDRLDRMLFHDWQFTLADNDLRKVSRACELAGIAVNYPLLDDELIALSTRVPTAIKVRNGELRHFYKQALQGWLPYATLEKSKHGFGLPFGVWMREHAPLRDIAYDSIAALRKRAIFKPEFLDDAVRRHRQEHAAYYGELIWILTTLELWLAAHHAAFSLED